MVLKNYFNNLLKYDFVNKFRYSLNRSIPGIQKIVITISFKHSNIKTITSSALLLKIFSDSNVKILKKKKTKLFLKLKKGEIAGCQIIFSKKYYYLLWFKLIYEILPYTLTVVKLSKNNINYVSIKFNKNFFFNELETFYSFFKDVAKINFSIVLNSTDVKEVAFLLTSIKIKNVFVK